MIPLAKGADIQLRRSALGRALGYGEVIIESAGQRRIAQNFIPYPEQVFAELSDLISPDKEGSSDNLGAFGIHRPVDCTAHRQVTG
jgi:Bacterial PH domain